MYKRLWILLITLILAGCSTNSATPTQTVEGNVPTKAASQLPAETLTPTPTQTIIPSNTPVPSNTPAPTATPIPTSTPTPALPLGLGSPLPGGAQPILADNAAKITLLGRYSGEPYGVSAVSADGKRTIFASSEGIEVFDLVQQKLLDRVDTYIRWDQYMYTEGWLSISGDGTIIGVVTADDLRVLSADGKLLYALPSRPNELYPSLAIMDGIGVSPDGKLAALVDCAEGEYNGCPFQIVRTDTGEVVYTWNNKMLSLHGASPVFSPDGSILATWFDNRLWFWNTSDWTAISDLPREEQQGWVFSPDGKQIALGGATLQLWDIATRKLDRELQPNEVTPLYPFFSPDGKWVAGAGWAGQVAVWSTADGKLVAEQTLPFNDVARMRLIDGKAEIVSLPGHDASLWGRAVGEDAFQFVEQDDVSMLAMVQGNQGCRLNLNGQADCQSGNYMILGSDGNFYRGNEQDHMVEFRFGLDGSGEIAASMTWSGYMLNPAGIDPQNHFFFYSLWSGPNNADVFALDSEKGTTIKKWTNTWMSRVSYSPDGKYAAFVLDHNPGYGLVLFDRVNRLPVFQKTYPFGVSSQGVVFTPDSRKMVLLVGDASKQSLVIEIMDVASPHQTTPVTLSLPEQVFLRSMAVSPDGKLLAVGLSDGHIQLTQVADGETVFDWLAHREWVGELAFSGDGKYLAWPVRTVM